MFPFALIFFLLAQLHSSAPVWKKYEVRPTHDHTSPSGVYVPKDLEESLAELDRMLSPELKEEIRGSNWLGLSEYHLGLGMWLRNNWGLWRGSQLSKYFNGLGIHHPDDMSALIIESYWRRLNKKPVQVERQAVIYKVYWKFFHGFRVKKR